MVVVVVVVAAQVIDSQKFDNIYFCLWWLILCVIIWYELMRQIKNY